MTASTSYDSMSASACVMSERCPGVRTKPSGLPRASTAAWSFVVKPPRERPRASASGVVFLTGGMLMGSNRGRVDHQPFQVGLLQGLEDTGPDALLGPAVEALEDTVPVAVAL